MAVMMAATTVEKMVVMMVETKAAWMGRRMVHSSADQMAQMMGLPRVQS